MDADRINCFDGSYPHRTRPVFHCVNSMFAVVMIGCKCKWLYLNREKYETFYWQIKKNIVIIWISTYFPIKYFRNPNLQFHKIFTCDVKINIIHSTSDAQEIKTLSNVGFTRKNFVCESIVLSLSYSTSFKKREPSIQMKKPLSELESSTRDTILMFNFGFGSGNQGRMFIICIFH